MLTISNIPEALAELKRQTGRAWTDSEIFDLATNCDIELHAAPPITARITIQKFIVGEGLVEKFRSPPGHALLAVLFPWQVAQLWMSGETKTSHPSKHDEMEGEYQLFTEPVRITREQVRIKAATLQKMFAIWSQAQAGRWIEDATKPGDMRYQNCPEWMFSPEEFAPGQSNATPALNEVDFDMVATRQKLIDAFGRPTGMNLTWFDNLNDSPKLKAARKCAGQGGRTPAEPLFCPFEVMLWLAEPKRKKGNPLKNADAWRMLKKNFVKVYNLHSIGDPNPD